MFSAVELGYVVFIIQGLDCGESGFIAQGLKVLTSTEPSVRDA